METTDLVAGGVEGLFVGDVAVDDERVAAGRQHVGPDDSDVVPMTVVDGRRRVDDDRPRPVARVEHVPRPPVDQLDGQEVAVDDAGPAVYQQAV